MPREAPVEDIQRASAAQTLAQQRAISPLEIEAMRQTAPYRQALLGTYQPRIGRMNFPEAHLAVPETLQESEAAALARLRGAGPDTEAYKKAVLGDFDVGQQRMQEAERNRIIAQFGLGSSGPGYELLNRQAAESARQRGLLGSELNLQADELQRQRIADALGVGQGQYERGQGEFERNQLLGFTQPMQAFQAAGMNPTVQPVSPFYSSPPPRLNTSQMLLGQAAGAFGTAAGRGIGQNTFGGGQDTGTTTGIQKAGQGIQTASMFLPPPFNLIGQAVGTGMNIFGGRRRPSPISPGNQSLFPTSSGSGYSGYGGSGRYG